MSTLRLPLTPERTVLMTVGDLPMTEYEWDRLHAILAAMKPGLVEESTRLLDLYPASEEVGEP